MSCSKLALAVFTASVVDAKLLRMKTGGAKCANAGGTDVGEGLTALTCAAAGKGPVYAADACKTTVPAASSSFLQTLLASATCNVINVCCFDKTKTGDAVYSNAQCAAYLGAGATWDADATVTEADAPGCSSCANSCEVADNNVNIEKALKACCTAAPSTNTNTNTNSTTKAPADGSSCR